MKSKATVYDGLRTPFVHVLVNNQVLSPDASQEVYNHSPDGFEWGYGGSGASQLALAILLDYYGPHAEQLRRYQQFKWNVVAHFPQDGDWSITGADIEAAMQKIVEDAAA